MKSKYQATKIIILLTINVCLAGCNQEDPGKLTAEFTADPLTGGAPLTVQFTDASVIEKRLSAAFVKKYLFFLPQWFSKEGSVTTWAWDFGDGETSAEQNPIHTYKSGGEYTVVLTVTSENGKIDKVLKEEYISAVNVEFTASQTCGFESLTVYFTDQTQPDDSIKKRLWNFGDSETSTSQTPNHKYKKEGAYSVSLEITTKSEKKHIITKNNYINIKQLSFIADKTAGSTPLSVQFTSQSICDNLTLGSASFFWDFGDGFTSSEPNPMHIYGISGVYTVSHTITLSNGHSGVASQKNYITAQFSEQDHTVMLPGDVPLQLLWIPAGTFLMGRYDGEEDSFSDESPQHSVTLSKGFFMGKYEVTQEQWYAIMNSWPTKKPSEEYGLGPNYPIYYISSSEAKKFNTALNSHIADTNQGAATIKLPSEEQWEYAYRAGTTNSYYWVNNDQEIWDYAWFYGNRNDPRGTKPVGGKLPNPWGLYDMAGNVYEWCIYESYTYPTNSVTDPTPSTANYYLYRGGSWYSSDYVCRAAARKAAVSDDYESSDPDKATGIRVVRTIL